ncbi:MULTISPECIES: hypothetical protein [unclassified Clostridioides]|uniref:hypothetical protein n=1 Tax=unclassified Clostridioides TaxID=2635829 RepID=UPI001D1106A1|nr:hypothetical protein [Clostridioides sp. ZZV14-6150]MCC0724373.1 hypothetical protein [Clostridioides sp. ZZV14-6104]MCC0742104.1 hypothetical protein [Clostridioides sp. ZZV14-6044]MCC0752974.1 hypothetical protein [Clostridioides sp. ZZV13-5731]
MKHSIFLSYPQPFTQNQVDFIKEIKTYLEGIGFEPRTLGVTDYDMTTPLVAIRRLMLESNGLLTVAFRRSHIEKGSSKPNSDINKESIDLSDRWITSPYCHIEPAMAFQIGLPILVLREEGVIADGILERGATATYLPEFDLNKPVKEYLDSEEWKQLIREWEWYVRSVVKNKGCPPKLY